MPNLFSPLTLRSLTLRNRIMMSPMCMYSAAEDGQATDWHLAHYVARAAGGIGLVVIEATAVEPRGRISRNDLGLWDDSQVESLARITRLVQAEGAAMGVQLAHAGRKAFSTEKGRGPQMTVAPSALPFDEGWREPHELDKDEICLIVAAWQSAAARALAAGLDVIEIHAAHGYLGHQFLSPLANRRADAYGGSLAHRMRFLLEVTEAVRDVWPPDKPLFVRVSVTDWMAGGLTPDEGVVVARELGKRGVDVIDCSSGGNVATARIPAGPGYQVPFAEGIRRDAAIATAAVGMITSPVQAETVIRSGQADLVLLARELLRDPQFPLRAARELGVEGPWPRQYLRAK